MASVNSRAELFPNRAFTPTSDDFIMDDDPEFQARIPLRHHSSYENMNGRSFTDEPSHQYEDPSKLANEVFHSQSGGRPPPPSRSGNKRPRKKVNEAYEPVHSSQKRRRTFTDESDDGYHRDTCTKVFKVMAFFGFFFAVVAVVVLVLLLLGILPIASCENCKKELVPGQSTAARSVGSAQELWKVIKELRSNVSELSVAVKRKNEIISQLQRRDVEHTEKITELERRATDRLFFANNTKHNFSGLVGPRGPPGIDGPVGREGRDGADGKPGKPGPGNLSLCVHKKAESVPFTAEISGSGQNVIVTEEPKERIIGVTCSTEGTSEYNLQSVVNSAKNRQYRCVCRGRSQVFSASPGKAKCIMHYWVCPLLS